MAIKKLKSSQWQADYRDDKGMRYRKTFRLKGNAERFIRDQKKAIDDGTYISPRQSPTFREMAELWYGEKTLGIGSRSKRIPRPSTLWAWRIHLDKHLLPGLADKRLNQIDLGVVEKVRDALRKDGGVKGRRLSQQTVHKVLITATSIFKLAIKKKRTKENPAADTDRLGLDDGEIVNGEEHKRGIEGLSDNDVLSPDELRRLIAVTESDLYGTLVLTAILTGARHDELLALKWGAIDLEAGKIWIRESLTWARIKGETFEERWRFYPPKTKAGVRQLAIPPEMVSRFKTWKLKCPPSRLDLVFPTPEGNPIQRHHTLRCGLHPLLRRAGLRTVDIHSLRHSFASALIMSGAPVTEVKAVMGHSNATTTLNIYAHWFKEAETGAMTKLARILMAKKSPQKASDEGHGHFLDTLEVRSEGDKVVGGVK